MKIYRVHHRDATHESKCYEYFWSKVKAEKALKETARDYKFEFSEEDMDLIEFQLTRRGIMGLLITCGSHPDNG